MAFRQRIAILLFGNRHHTSRAFAFARILSAHQLQHCEPGFGCALLNGRPAGNATRCRIGNCQVPSRIGARRRIVWRCALCGRREARNFTESGSVRRAVATTWFSI